MRNYYTRACNFYYGSEAQELIIKKLALPLCGNKNIAFDYIEILSRDKKNKLIHIKKIVLVLLMASAYGHAQQQPNFLFFEQKIKLGLYNFMRFFKKKLSILVSKIATVQPFLTKAKYPTMVSKLFSPNKKINFFLVGSFFDNTSASLSN